MAKASVFVVAAALLGSMTAAAYSGNVPTSGKTSAPKGFSAFCASNPSQCRSSNSNVRVINMDAKRWKELKQVNARVNRGVKYASAGIGDRWTVAGSDGGAGDCKTYVMSKRKQLLQMGWPSSVLLVTSVKTRGGEGHAVLTVRTDEGDYLLDNRYSSIRRSTSTEYRFFAMQSASDPRSWVAVPRDGSTRTAMLD